MARPRDDDLFAAEYAVVALRPSWSLVALTILVLSGLAALAIYFILPRFAS